jgi:hypothetical protein
MFELFVGILTSKIKNLDKNQALEQENKSRHRIKYFEGFLFYNYLI